MKHFKIEEFNCKCCNRNNMQPRLLCRLDDARQMAGVAFVVTSGFRCPTHNRAVGGAVTSSHLGGWAVDIACPSSADRERILFGLIMVGVRRIGIGKNFIHADVDPGKQPAIWLY